METSNLDFLSIYWLARGLCIYSHLLLEEASLMLTGQDKALIYEYSRKALGIILLIFFQTSSVWFYPRSLGCLVSGSLFLVSQARSSIGYILWSGPYVKPDIGCKRHKFCATIALAYLAGRTDCRSEILWLGRSLCFSFWYPAVYLPLPETPERSSPHSFMGVIIVSYLQHVLIFIHLT